MTARTWSSRGRSPRVFVWATRDTRTWLFLSGTGRDSCWELDLAMHGSGQEQTLSWWNDQTLAESNALAVLSLPGAGEREVLQ